MNNEMRSIHEFDFNLICEYFSNLDRQGPGSQEVTLQALSFVENLSEKSRIADLGCGTGGQTMVLAQHTTGDITGLDLYPGFIDQLNRSTADLNLQGRVHGIVGSMEQLPFGYESLDLIWSEGAIAHIGFKRGLTEWRNYLKADGYIAISDAAWFTDERPAEIEKFWIDAYPEIDTIPSKVAQLQSAGYIPVANFILPEKCWTENYFEPQRTIQEKMLMANQGNAMLKDFIDSQRHHAQLYKKYKALHGYVFFIAKKITL